jgi:hypothetical protein
VIRGRFADVIRRQIDLFEDEQSALIAECDAAEEAYDRADRDEAEERYADYLDLVETGTELIAGLRDNYATTMDEETAEEYAEEFNHTVRVRLPRFALEIEDL